MGRKKQITDSNIDAKQVKKLAAQGKTTTEIAEQFGVSKCTFIRAKRGNATLTAAYESGKGAFAKSRGMVAEKRGGKMMVVGIGSVPGVPSRPKVNLDQLVLDHLTSNPNVNSFHGIRNAVRLSSDDLANVFLNLIIHRRLVRPVRDANDNFRYLLRVNQHQNGNRLNGSIPTGIPHAQTGWATTS
jgi:hypothetical protein